VNFIFLNSEYTCKQILTKSVGLDTPNSKYYALHNKYNIKCELGKLQLTQYNQHTTDGELSITEHSHMQTRHIFLVYNMADRSNRRYGDTLRHAAVWSSAKPTPHSTILRSHTNVHQLRLRLTLPNSHTDVFKLRHKVTPKISSVTRHLTSPDNNKHNDTINLHAQNCCTHKLHNQTHSKISQNVYKSKRLVANDVQVSHT